MYAYKLTRSGSSNPSLLTGATTPLTTDIIDLHEKRHDGKRLWLDINITGGGSLALWAAGHYTPSSVTTSFIPVSFGGITVQLAGGTSVNSSLGNGRHIIQLIWSRRGVTEPLTAIPYLRIGFIGFWKPVKWTGHLIYG